MGNIVPSRSAPRPADQSLRRQLSAKGPSHRAVTPLWRGYALHAMTFSAGCDTPSFPAYDFHGLKRGQAEWALFQFTLKGQGMLRYENQTAPVLTGQAMLLTLPHDHRYWIAPNQPWSFFYLCMQGSEILRAWQQVIKQAGPILSLSPQSIVLQKAASLCTDVLANNINSPWALSARTYDLAMSLVAMTQPQSTAAAHTATSGDAQKRTRPLAIQKAIDLIRLYPDDALNVARLANAAGLSRHHFSRLFAQCEGMGPGEYLARVRLRLAVKLLQTTELPIKHIAMDCGFTDANYFAKAFRKAYGLSPRDFRSRGMGRAVSE